MAVTLSPWPPITSAANRVAAVKRLSEAIGGRTNLDGTPNAEAANHLGEAAAAMVEDYAPGAPQALRDEAVIRFAGYLAGSDYGAIVSETSVASAQVTYVVNHSNAWRNSGAAMLLTRWRIRRAGAIG